MLEVGLIDSSWLAQLLPQHAARLQQLIDTKYLFLQGGMVSTEEATVVTEDEFNEKAQA